MKETEIAEKHIVNDTRLNNSNPFLTQFPLEIQDEIQNLARENSIPLNYWGFDPVNKEIDLFAYGIHNMTATKYLQGKKINNYTIQVFNNTTFQTTKGEVRAYLGQLMNNPDYKVASTDMILTGDYVNPTGPYVELWVYESTPANEKLNNKAITGWKILVYSVVPLPTDVGNSSKTNISDGSKSNLR